MSVPDSTIGFKLGDIVWSTHKGYYVIYNQVEMGSEQSYRAALKTKLGNPQVHVDREPGLTLWISGTLHR